MLVSLLASLLSGSQSVLNPQLACDRAGIRVEKGRLRKEMSRQAAATVTTHHVHLFSVLLSAAEMDSARLCAEEK